jgi:translocation and assembly module TamB
MASSITAASQEAFAMADPSPTPRKRRRRWWRLVVILALFVIATIAALPWALSTGPGRRWMLARVNHALAPGRLHVDAVRLSWFRPTEFTGFTLIDRQGGRVAFAPVAVWDRKFGQILFGRARLGTLRLDQAALDIERRSDGSLDLFETLQPVLGRDPRRDLTIQVDHGSLRFRSPGLAEPLQADRAELILHLAPAPDPIAGRLRLASGARGALEVRGFYHRWQEASHPPDLVIEVASQRWPTVLDVSGVRAEGLFDGDFAIRRAGSSWALTGQAALVDLDASSPHWPKNRVHLDRLDASWDVAQDSGAWTIRRLGLESSRAGLQAKGQIKGIWDDHKFIIDEVRVALAPHDKGAVREGALAWSARGRFGREEGVLVLEPVASAQPAAVALAPEGLRITGLGQRAGGARAEGVFVGDIAALANVVAAWSGRSAADWGGSWSSRWTISQDEQGWRFAGKTEVRDLSWPAADGQGLWSEPLTTLNLRASYRTEADRLDLAELALSSQYGTLEAKGSLSDPLDRRKTDLKGTLSPDWKAVNAMLAERVEPGARLEGQPRPFRLRGSLAVDSLDELLKGIEAEAGFDLVKADFYGMRVGATPIVLRVSGGHVTMDPIRATLNNGRLQLDPQWRVEDDGGLTLRLAPGPVIEGAEVNDEVSNRVLSYVAPVLREATRVHGLVSAEVQRAEFPIGPSLRKKAIVEGQVIFREVEFAPGPLADELLDLIGRQDRPSLRLDQPVELTIAEGRVEQHGLALPVGKLTRIELEGSVDFDRNLDLTASLPITTGMLGNNPVLSEIAAGTKISVPITGTMSKPKIDREAFRANLKDLGRTLLERGAVAGIAELLKRLTRPRDPNAPPPPPRLTPEERKARRQERRQQRQMERQQRRERRRERAESGP